MKYIIIFSLAWLFSACQTDQKNEVDPEAFRTGAEMLVEQNFGFLNGKNVGIITNHTATVNGRHIADVLHEAAEVNVVALFGPEHGIRGDARGRIEFEVDESTGLAVHSLYGEVRRPTPEMLEGIDVLVFDIQDIGPRFYTYISTMGMAMEAAAELGISFMVLDRPNPLGGILTEGFVREEGQESFVGYFPIPVTHGLSIGELALMARDESMLDGTDELDLHIVEMKNWDRKLLWPELNRDWSIPSPNIPDFETALVYPGGCFFEATTISEGRGTMEPFILIGAPWGNADEFAAEMNARNLPGLRFEPAIFTPESITYRGMAANPKLQGVELQGVRHVVTDRYAVRPVEAGIHLLHTFYHYAPDYAKADFFRETGLNRLAGTKRLHELLVAGSTAEEIIASWSDELHNYDQMKRRYHLYN